MKSRSILQEHELVRLRPILGTWLLSDDNPV